MARAKLRHVQIRNTLLDAECLSSRVNTESIQYEVMINYIIAVTLHTRRNSVFGSLSTFIFTDDITCVMNSYWIDSLFTLEHNPSASSTVSLICTVPGLALAMMFLHSVHL